MIGELKVVARRAGLWETVIKLHFFKRDTPGMIDVLLGNAWQQIPAGYVVDEDISGVELPLTAAQQLMDELWDCGIRPTQGSGSAGSLAATEKHLADMQDLVDRLFRIIEKPTGTP